MYDINIFKEVNLYKYLKINLHHKLNWNYSIEKMINGGLNAYYGVENNCKSPNSWFWDDKKLLFEILVTLLSYMVAKFGVATSPKNCG
jgi:hypothetical protein